MLERGHLAPSRSRVGFLFLVFSETNQKRAWSCIDIKCSSKNADFYAFPFAMRPSVYRYRRVYRYFGIQIQAIQIVWMSHFQRDNTPGRKKNCRKERKFWTLTFFLLQMAILRIIFQLKSSKKIKKFKFWENFKKISSVCLLESSRFWETLSGG